MKVIRYKTNRLLWVLIAFLLFAPYWFQPTIFYFGPFIKGPIKAIDVLKDLFANAFSSQRNFGNSSEDALMLLIFSLVIGSIAVVIAWPLQCAIVIVRSKIRETKPL